MTRIFVYGTLKRGGSNQHFLDGQTFLGEARTPPGYTLYRIEDYPGMVKAPHAPGVSGEVWAVSSSCLRTLDVLEGLDEGLYCREPIRLLPPFDADAVETYRYLRPVAQNAHLGENWME